MDCKKKVSLHPRSYLVQSTRRDVIKFNWFLSDQIEPRQYHFAKFCQKCTQTLKIRLGSEINRNWKVGQKSTIGWETTINFDQHCTFYYVYWFIQTIHLRVFEWFEMAIDLIVPTNNTKNWQISPCLKTGHFHSKKSHLPLWLNPHIKTGIISVKLNLHFYKNITA